MLCFIMKLKEKKKELVDVFIVSLKDDELPEYEETRSMTGQMIKAHMNMKDVSIECNDHMQIIALFEKTHEEIERFKKDLDAQAAFVSYEHL